MKNRIIFVVVGRLGKSLTTSKILPILASNEVSHIYVFREYAGNPLRNVTYITSSMPMWIKPTLLSKILQRAFEPVQLLYYTFKLKPFLINGYQLIPKGINSFISAKLTRTISMMSSIGGIPEIDTYFKFNWFWRNLNLYILRNSDVVTTKGKTVTDYIVRFGVLRGKIHTYNGAIDTARFCPNESVTKDIDLLFVGGLCEVKGPDRFVRVAKGVCEQFPELKCKMLGDGDLEQITRKMIETLGLSHSISIEGYIEKPEGYLQRAKIILMPSRSEGLSTAMLEAMACGCVPVVSNVGCMNEAAIQAETALIVNNYLDIESYTASVLLLLRDSSMLASLSRKASVFVRERYCIEAQARVFTKIITELEDRKR